MKFLDFEQIKGLGLTAEELFQWTCEVWEKQDTFDMLTSITLR